jgi:hypothetical protein
MLRYTFSECWDRRRRWIPAMYILAINGSPRKSWNTAKLLQSALKGAEDCGADTELIHLYP